MKNRFYLIVICLVFLVIIIVAAVASSGGSKSPAPITTQDSMIAAVTINNNIGIQSITIANLNTGNTYTATLIDLPFKFNCTVGDNIKFTVTTQQGYTWNSWWFQSQNALDGTFNNHNPLILTVNGNVAMTPRCTIVETTPTPTPSPTPSPTNSAS